MANEWRRVERVTTMKAAEVFQCVVEGWRPTDVWYDLVFPAADEGIVSFGKWILTWERQQTG